MDYKINGFEPAALFRNFEDFSAVPRGSFHNEKISDFLVKFAKDRGLEVYQDEALNVIIKKPGQNGGEGKPPVILQGHMDMVCEKVHGCGHDFETQGIDMYVTDDGWLTANGTTLGGDDGIADATMMTLLDDDTLTYPPLECVFTTDEEVGLLGANVLDYSKLDGRLMLNLDSEDEGVATVSCAGGMDYTMTRALTCETQSGETVSIDVKGLLGGHSGTDIDLGHTNADKLIARAVLSVLEDRQKTNSAPSATRSSMRSVLSSPASTSPSAAQRRKSRSCPVRTRKPSSPPSSCRRTASRRETPSWTTSSSVL